MAKGACYQYDYGALIGCFPYNEPFISYQQNFNTMYLGVSGNYMIKAFELSSELKYGPWVQSSDVDQHYSHAISPLRRATFKDKGDQASFYSATITSGYHLNRKAIMFIEAAYQQFTHTIADTKFKKYLGGVRGFVNNGGGLSNKNYFLALGIRYNT